ncbi:MAG: hypothetical protein ACRDJI_02730 [Actinomycetota bacterium]
MDYVPAPAVGERGGRDDDGTYQGRRDRYQYSLQPRHGRFSF